MNGAKSSPHPRSVLQSIWGYDRFRDPQEDIIQTLMAGQDALVIMPTGGGKSLCFQVPALIRPGLTLVLSPLVALMENQVQDLRAKKIPAALLHSQLDRSQRKRILSDLERRSLKLLYLSPETLLSPPVWQRLSHPDLPIGLMVLDEAHCLAQWGETFRPTYFRLGAVRDALSSVKSQTFRMNIAAFTATANATVQTTIQSVLRLQTPAVFRLNPYRSNLRLQVQTVWTPHDRRQRLWRFVQQQGRSSGLVYVRTRQESETLAAWLQQRGCQTAAYHAGLGASDRRRIEQAWLGDRLQFVVSTNAFGMGVNKPNVRWIVHFHAPLLLSEYLQEIGRAGRDGKSAVALLLVSESTGWLDGTDRQRWQFFQQQSHQQIQRSRQLLHKIPKAGALADLLQQDADAEYALSLLQTEGQLRWTDPFHYELQPTNLKSGVTRRSSITVNEMIPYIQTRQCRWQYLLQAFDFDHESQTLRCGQCDRCCPK